MSVEASLIVVAVALALLAVATYLVEGPGEMNDLEVFHRAGARFLQGAPLYRAEDGHFAFKYLPIAAALLAPLALVPLGAAKIVWLVGCWLALAFAFVLAARLAGARLPWWAPLAGFAVLARAIEREIANGQINALLLLLVAGAFVLLGKRRDVAAGALLALAALLKPPWLVMLPYLLVARRGRAAAALVVIVGAGLVLPAGRYGIDGTLELLHQLRALLAASTAHLLTYPTNISLPGAIAKLTGRETGAFLAAMAILAVPGVVFARRAWREGSRGAADLALLAPMAILASPQAWDYTVLTALPALLLAATEAPRLRPAFRVTTLVLAGVVALDPVLLFGRGHVYEAVMHASPNTWPTLWLLGLALCAPRSRRAFAAPAAANEEGDTHRERERGERRGAASRRGAAPA